MIPDNGNSNPNEAVEGKAYFCPKCGSSAIDVGSLLAGGESRCNVCGWRGKMDDLVVHVFQHGMLSEEEIHRAFFMDLRRLFGVEFVLPFGRLLVKWGYLSTPADPKILARYVATVARATAKALVEERLAQEKERVEGTT